MGQGAGSFLLDNAAVVTMDSARNVFSPGAVLVEGGLIREVGDSARVAAAGRESGAEIIDVGGDIICPGLVNSHTHLAMALLRGFADDLPLEIWLNEHIWPAEGRFVSPEFVRDGVELAAAEMIRGGTTLFCDQYFFQRTAADVVRRAGLRGVLAEGILGFPTASYKDTASALAAVREMLEEFAGDPMIVIPVSPHAIYTVPADVMTRCAGLAAEFDSAIHVHLSETRFEVETSVKENGKSPVKYLADLGILGPKTSCAHCVWLDEKDIEIMADTGAGVAHCPESNMKLASGMAPVADYLAAGINVGIGTDGAASNNDLDMFAETRSASLLAKVRTLDPTSLPAANAFKAATIGGVRLFALDKVTGSLEAGKSADMAVIDANLPHMLPRYDVYSHLVYAVKASDVRHTICAGRFLMKDRVLLTLDEDEIRSKAREWGERIASYGGKGE